jgi:hypothetical protein
VQPRASGRFCRQLEQAFTGTIGPIRGIAEPQVTPDITTAILEGRQPPGLTATMLIEHPALPLSWQQRTALGFV